MFSKYPANIKLQANAYESRINKSAKCTKWSVTYISQEIISQVLVIPYSSMLYCLKYVQNVDTIEEIFTYQGGISPRCEVVRECYH